MQWAGASIKTELNVNTRSVWGALAMVFQRARVFKHLAKAGLCERGQLRHVGLKLSH